MSGGKKKYFGRLLVAAVFLKTGLVCAMLEEPEVRRAVPVSSSNSFSSESNASDIRVAPVVSSDASQLAAAQLAVAEGFFNRREFDVAVPEYEKFLKMTSPGQPYREEALFHLGEALRLLNNGFSAESTYLQLLKEKPSGEFAASAAYRLGVYHQKRKETKVAVEAFAQAAQLSTNPPLQNAAHYQEALCRDELGEEAQATTLLGEITKTSENDETRIHALMLLAAREDKSGNKEKALADYLSISHDATGGVVAEALVKAAMISNDIGKKEEALQLFEKASAVKDGAEWIGVAALGSMKLFSAAKDYKKILSKIDQASSSSSLEVRSEAFLLAANAQRQLGCEQSALALYDKILQEFPGTDPAREAAFNRLLVLQRLHDSKIMPQIEEYLLATSDTHQRSLAQLLKAEVLFQDGKYAEAAGAYSNLKSTDLSSELKADALYKEAWSLAHIGDFKGALSCLSELITTYPNSPRLVAVIVQRASLRQRTGDLPGAIADYTLLLNNHPTAPERELALQQMALTQGELRDNKAMTTTFQQLLKEFPQSAAASQANFWIGWAAFENKDYTGAIPFLEKARQLDPKQFGERAGVRTLLCHYYLEQVPETMSAAVSLKPSAVPAEVSRWLGLKAYEMGDMAQTERFLTAVEKSDKKNLLTEEVEAALATALVKQEKFSQAEAPVKRALELSTDPLTRAEAILTQSTLEKGLEKYDEAEKSANEALLLQPEGRINILARMLLADIFFLQKKYDAAARAYMAVTLLTSDSSVTPLALRKAAEAYRRANNLPEAQKATEELQKINSR